MANPKGNPKNLKAPFAKGTSANPGGKPVASRNRLQGDFMRALADDFAENGVTAIQRTRQEQPAQYLKVVASLMPKELEIKRPLEEMTDDDLIAGVAALQSFIDAQRTQGGASGEEGEQPASGLPSLH